MNARLKPETPPEIKHLLVSRNDVDFDARLHNARRNCTDIDTKAILDYVNAKVTVLRTWRALDTQDRTPEEAQTLFRQAYEFWWNHPNRQEMERCDTTHGIILVARGLFAVVDDSDAMQREFARLTE